MTPSLLYEWERFGLTLQHAGRNYPVIAFDDFRGRAWQQGRFHDAAFLNRSLTLAPTGKAIVDCGANCGSHSLFWALHGYSVEAIEGHLSIFQTLAHNLQNVPNVNTHLAALWSDDCTRLDCRLFTNPGQTTFFPAERGMLSRTLDSFEFQNVGLVKVDCEGAEIEVLRGADKLLSQHPILCVEVHHPITNDQVIECLAQYGYTVGADLFLT